ncbi:MAG TPA: hypothetical protein VMU39_27650 [Solirubrobacteraceae bacterium]|nr:hypothetical protein [Solirubrobacteraceae bacterium]
MYLQLRKVRELAARLAYGKNDPNPLRLQATGDECEGQRRTPI